MRLELLSKYNNLRPGLRALGLLHSIRSPYFLVLVARVLSGKDRSFPKYKV